MKRHAARFALLLLAYLAIVPIAAAILAVTAANLVLSALEILGAVLLTLMKWTRHDRFP